MTSFRSLAESPGIPHPEPTSAPGLSQNQLLTSPATHRVHSTRHPAKFASSSRQLYIHRQSFPDYPRRLESSTGYREFLFSQPRRTIARNPPFRYHQKGSHQKWCWLPLALRSGDQPSAGPLFGAYDAASCFAPTWRTSFSALLADLRLRNRSLHPPVQPLAPHSDSASMIRCLSTRFCPGQSWGPTTPHVPIGQILTKR